MKKRDDTDTIQSPNMSKTFQNKSKQYSHQNKQGSLTAMDNDKTNHRYPCNEHIQMLPTLPLSPCVACAQTGRGPSSQASSQTLRPTMLFGPGRGQLMNIANYLKGQQTYANDCKRMYGHDMRIYAYIYICVCVL